MKFGSLFLALQCAASVLAYRIVEGSVSVGDDNIEIGEFNAQVIRQLPIGPKDKIEVSLKIDELTKKPHQSLITVGTGNGLEYSVVPQVSFAANSIKASIPVTQFPPSIKAQDILFLRIILADKNNADGNLLQSIVELIPTSDLHASIPSSYKKAERIGIKPEIHHIFKSDPSTINPFIPVVFIFGVITLFLGLIIAWATSIGNDLFNHFSDISGIQLIYDLSFLSCLVGYEITFVKYYLGSSIFTTMFYAAVLGGPSVYFGSRVFRDLAKFRKIGK